MGIIRSKLIYLINIVIFVIISIFFVFDMVKYNNIIFIYEW